MTQHGEGYRGYLCSHSSVSGEGGSKSGTLVGFSAFRFRSDRILYTLALTQSKGTRLSCQGSMAFHCHFFSLTTADLSVLEEAGLLFCSLFYVHECSDQKGLTFLKVTQKKLSKAGKFLRSRSSIKPLETSNFLWFAQGSLRQAHSPSAKLHLCTCCSWVARTQRAW